MDRRTVLRGGVASIGAGVLGTALGCAPVPGPPSGQPVGPFDCGVASGLHRHDAAVLWTRFAPGAQSPVELTWQVAADPSFASIVADGVGVAAPDVDGCVKVLAEGLPPGATLWYRFRVEDLVSPVGRTRLVAAPGASPERVRLAVASCQSYSMGWFTAWRAVAAEDLDAVVHLGDYIYETGGLAPPLGVRRDPLGTVTDLDGYRAKYRLYRSDPDLQAAHAAHAFIPVWDDHELVNNFHRVTLLEDPDRAAAAFRAWWEYQPVWPVDGDRIHRRVRWGDLVDLTMLDTRQFRDPQVVGPDGREAFVGSTAMWPFDAAHDPERTILGAEQRDWLLEGFGAAEADGVRWKLVGNQVMISPIRVLDLDEPLLRLLDPDLPRNAGVYLNFDDWDGYQGDRVRVTEWLRGEAVSNVGFLTGDVHMFFQSSVLADHDEPGSPVVAQEFVCGSISSRGADYAGPLAAELGRATSTLRPPFRYTDFERRGYGLVECTPDGSSVDYVTVDALVRTGWTTEPRRRVRFDWPDGSHAISLTRT